MKARKYHIICSRILLICFIAGQFMVYAHQHLNYGTTGKCYSTCKGQSAETVKEKCAVCDAMHYNSMDSVHSIHFNSFLAFGHIYKTFEYNFKSISIILASGRAPPFQITFFI